MSSASSVPPESLDANAVTIAVLGASLSYGGLAGTVVAAGAQASHWLERQVLVPPLLCCGECAFCRRGRCTSCPAQIWPLPAPYVTVPARALCTFDPAFIREGEPFWQLSALAGAASASYAGLMRVGIEPNELVVIVGGGIRGLFALFIAAQRGARPVMVDPTVGLQALARSWGACAVLSDSSGEAIASGLDEVARSEGLRPGALKILETSGRPAGRAVALALGARGAVVGLLAAPDAPSGPSAAEHPETAQQDWSSFVASEGELLGIRACHPDLLPELCALWKRGDRSLGELVQSVSVAESEAARHAYLSGNSRKLPILCF